MLASSLSTIGSACNTRTGGLITLRSSRGAPSYVVAHSSNTTGGMFDSVGGAVRSATGMAASDSAIVSC